MKEIGRLLSYLGIALLMSGSVIGLVLLIDMFPEERVSGQPAPLPEHATGPMTTYCIDGGMRVFERPFPQGGKQPLFSVVYTGGLNNDHPHYCEV